CKMRFCRLPLAGKPRSNTVPGPWTPKMRALTLVPALCALIAVAPPLHAQTPGATDEVRLGPGDVVRIEAMLARSGLLDTLAATGRGGGGGDYTVDADGLALLPLLGLVRVANRPFVEVRREIERAYAEEYVDATVRVTPLVRIALLGEVRTPGLLPVDPTMTLADVVAAAGGLTPSANRSDIRLWRQDETVLLAVEGELVGLRIPLRSGDRIVIGRRSWASENLPFVLGAGASVVAAVLTALIVR
ncbi:MAG: SLBB domain-containing protein, partial [Longimicrobiales bacterium]|nr:SLBB domain-containing protein [Longimicrobiales bacterium]